MNKKTLNYKSNYAGKMQRSQEKTTIWQKLYIS